MILRKQSWIIDKCIGLYSFQDLSINSSSHIQHVYNGNIRVEGQLNLSKLHSKMITMVTIKVITAMMKMLFEHMSLTNVIISYSTLKSTRFLTCVNTPHKDKHEYKRKSSNCGVINYVVVVKKIGIWRKLFSTYDTDINRSVFMILQLKLSWYFAFVELSNMTPNRVFAVSNSEQPVISSAWWGCMSISNAVCFNEC